MDPRFRWRVRGASGDGGGAETLQAATGLRATVIEEGEWSTISARRLGWLARANLSLATRVEYMDGKIDTVRLGTPPRRSGMTELTR